MTSNKINNSKALELVGPCRPQDIIRETPQNIKIVPVVDNPTKTLPLVKNNRARLEFCNVTYYKCGKNHIFIGGKFDSFNSGGRDISVLKLIPTTSHVHIFINDGCNIAGLVTFCDKVSDIRDVGITIHISQFCDTEITQFIIEYLPRLIKSIKISHDTVRTITDFWCTDWYSWERHRDILIQNNNLKVHLTSDNQRLVGIRIKFNHRDSFQIFALTPSYGPK